MFAISLHIARGLAPLMSPITNVCGQSSSRIPEKKDPLLERMELLKRYPNGPLKENSTSSLDKLLLGALGPLLKPITDIVRNDKDSDNRPSGYDLDDLELELRLNVLRNITYLSEGTDTASDIDEYVNLLNGICSDKDTDSHNSDEYLQ